MDDEEDYLYGDTDEMESKRLIEESVSKKATPQQKYTSVLF